MSKKNRDVPGNSLASQAQYQRDMLRLGETISRMERILDRMFEEEWIPKRVSIKVPVNQGDEYLVIITAESPGGPVVAFTSGQSFAEAIRVAIARIENGSVKWKEDAYAN